MAKKQETREMAQLYQNGWTLAEIAGKYGISPPAVWGRFERAGIKRRSRIKYQSIDQDLLETLYRENVPLSRIGAVFSVSELTLVAALDFYEIPRRKSLQSVDSPANYRRAVKMGADYRSGMSWRQVGKKYGISPQTAKSHLVKLAISHLRQRASAYTKINREQLEDWYSVKKLPIEDIAARIKSSASTIDRALEFYKIRKRDFRSSKHASVLRKLNIGETVEIDCPVKYPLTNLHTIAARVGVKISVRKQGGGKYKVTRVAPKTPKNQSE